MTAFALRTRAAKHVSRSHIFKQCGDLENATRERDTALSLIRSAVLLEQSEA